MIEDMQLHGLAAKTQDAYVRVVRQLAEYYHKSPEVISEEELRQYLLYLQNEKHVSASMFTIALCGLKFFYARPLQRTWHTFELARPVPEKKLPVVLSLNEVHDILSRLHRQRYRVCLTTIYAGGLRLREGGYLQVGDIDRARQLLHIRQGKGGPDRYVPLPDGALPFLRQSWSLHRHPCGSFRLRPVPACPSLLRHGPWMRAVFSALFGRRGRRAASRMPPASSPVPDEHKRSTRRDGACIPTCHPDPFAQCTPIRRTGTG